MDLRSWRSRLRVCVHGVLREDFQHAAVGAPAVRGSPGQAPAPGAMEAGR